MTRESDADETFFKAMFVLNYALLTDKLSHLDM